MILDILTEEKDLLANVLSQFIFATKRDYVNSLSHSNDDYLKKLENEIVMARELRSKIRNTHLVREVS